MKSTLLIGIAMLACACGSNGPKSDSSAPAAHSSSPPGGGAETTAAQASGKVTLVGCLHGPAQPAAAGTSASEAGERARARAAGTEAATAQTHRSAANGRYVLTNATVESGGVGANGAGASGGPLVSAGSEIELDGVPADAEGSVDKQVRVTGRIDSRPAGATPTTGTASAGGTQTGSASTRDDVQANSTTVAGDTTNRRLIVESVRVVGQSCSPL